jgi:hypothetical protein
VIIILSPLTTLSLSKSRKELKDERCRLSSEMADFFKAISQLSFADLIEIKIFSDNVPVFQGHFMSLSIFFTFNFTDNIASSATQVDIDTMAPVLFEKDGKKTAMTVIAKAELAQS